MDWEKQNKLDRLRNQGQKTETEIVVRVNPKLAKERASYHLKVLATLPEELQMKLKSKDLKEGEFAKLKTKVRLALAEGEFRDKSGHYIDQLIAEAPNLARLLA